MNGPQALLIIPEICYGYLKKQRRVILFNQRDNIEQSVKNSQNRQKKSME